MAEQTPPPLVTAFTGERYAAQERLSDLIAPPYDVVTAAERATLAARDRHNIVHLILPDGRPNPYAAAGKLLERWRAEGVLRRDATPSVYVIQQEFVLPDGRTCVRTGVIGALHVEPYARGRVRPHEHTHAEPKEDRLALARATGAMLETIFVLSRDRRGHLRRRLEGVTKHEPTTVAELDGVGIGVWKVGGAQAREIANVAGEGPLYIADGHHRFETANSYRTERPGAERMPALIVPLADPGLVVAPTHRLIVGGPVTLDVMLRHWEPMFTLEGLETLEPEPEPPVLLERLSGEEPTALVVLPDGQRVILRARQPLGGRELEIELIEREIIQPLVGAAGQGASVSYSPSPGEVCAAVGRHAAAAGVLVRPTPVERVLEVADAGGVLPPKSTYFVPKVPSGLVLMAYDG